MSAPLRNFAPRKLLTKRAHAAIMPLPAHQTGNNKPFSLKKTRRNWKPNVHAMDMPVNVLGGASTIAENLANLHAGKFVKGPALKKVRLAARDKKTVDKAGGVEGLLVSTKEGTECPKNALWYLHVWEGVRSRAESERGQIGLSEGSLSLSGAHWLRGFKREDCLLRRKETVKRAKQPGRDSRLPFPPGSSAPLA